MITRLPPRGLALGIGLALMGAGCASVTSQRLDTASAGTRGLTYFMPMHPLVLKLTVDKDGKRTVDIEVLDAIPDTRHRYLLNYSRSQAAKNTLEIAINSEGLLTGASKGKSVPAVVEIGKELAEVAGTVGQEPLFEILNTPGNPCAKEGVYRWTLLPRQESGYAACGLEVTMRTPGSGQPGAAAPASNYGAPTGLSFGLYYRQRMPMEVAVTSAGQTRYFFPSVASEASPISFLPIPRSFFSEVDWGITFDKGSPTLYKVEASGEIQGLLTLPTEVIAAYSTALTAGLNRRKGEDDARLQYLNKVQELAIAQARAARCEAAVATSDDVTVIRTACGTQ
ncbi:hypothetical protein [Arenimonas sp. MALMAid1274]|uniref:hypothetical protein n=1 Tax=Arenimonas sp. MALMAid1274 TaxID=3411630 RepID=UPI003B9F2D89